MTNLLQWYIVSVCHINIFIGPMSVLQTSFCAVHVHVSITIIDKVVVKIINYYVVCMDSLLNQSD